jgi:hypothetical protein
MKDSPTPRARNLGGRSHSGTHRRRWDMAASRGVGDDANSELVSGDGILRALRVRVI